METIDLYKCIDYLTSDNYDEIYCITDDKGLTEYIIEVMSMEDSELKIALNIDKIDVPRKLLLLKYLSNRIPEAYMSYLHTLKDEFLISLFKHIRFGNIRLEIEELINRSVILKKVFDIKSTEYTIELLKLLIERDENEMIEDVLNNVTIDDSTEITALLSKYTNHVLTKWVFDNIGKYFNNNVDVVLNIISDAMGIITTEPLLVSVFENLLKYVSADTIAECIIRTNNADVTILSILVKLDPSIDYDNLLEISKKLHSDNITKFILEILSQV